MIIQKTHAINSFLGTVHYLWAGGGRRFWGGGHLFLASRWEGGPLIFGKSLRGGATYFWREKILKSPRNPFFETFSYTILGRGPLIFHLIIRCPELQSHRSSRLINLQKFYTDEGKEPPCSEEEIYSAVINGDCYATTTSILTTTITLEKNQDEAQNLCSALCLKLYKERDYIINDRLMERN